MRHCPLCYTSLTVLFPGQVQSIWNGLPMQEIILKCNKYLPKDLIHPNTNWSVPVCKECQENTKQLVQLDLKLEQINVEIRALIDGITTKILNERQIYQSLYTHTSVSVPPTDVHLLNEKQCVDNTFDDLDFPVSGSNNSVYDDSLQEDTIPKSGDNLDDRFSERVNIAPKKRRKSNNSPRKEEKKSSNLKSTKSCGKVTSSDLQLKADSVGFACPDCNKIFWRLDILKRHDCGGTTFECETCGKSFFSQSSLQIHNRIHTGEKPHKCETCGKSFTMSHHLRQHLATHTEEKAYQCEICKKCFKTENYLFIHKRQHSTDENERKKYKCDICSKTFVRYTSLKNHLVIHTGKSKHKCQVCEKIYTTNRDLRRHQLTHTGERNFKCSFCWKSFNREGTLKMHEVKHTGRKDFQCDECEESYYTSQNLNLHKKRKHIDGGEFVCDACGKLYKTKAAFNLHMQIHDKPVKSSVPSPKIFVCGVCDRSYNNNRNLLSHQRVVHRVTTISNVCEKCGKDFETIMDYHYHTLYRFSRYGCKICDQAFRNRCAMICHFNEKHTESEFPYKCGCGSAFLVIKDLFQHKQNTCTVMKQITGMIGNQVSSRKKSKAKAEGFSELNDNESDNVEKDYGANSDLSSIDLRRSSRMRNKNERINKEDSEKLSGEKSDEYYVENSASELEGEESVEIKTDPDIWVKEEPDSFSD